MVKTQELRGIIVARGTTQEGVARALGISNKTFYNKMKKGVFNTDEAAKMTRILKIENPADIFLSDE